jgi:hypothetical protein
VLREKKVDAGTAAGSATHHGITTTTINNHNDTNCRLRPLASWLGAARRPTARETERAFRPLAAALRRTTGQPQEEEEGDDDAKKENEEAGGLAVGLPPLVLALALGKALTRLLPHQPPPPPREPRPPLPRAAATTSDDDNAPLLAAAALALAQMTACAAKSAAAKPAAEGAEAEAAKRMLRGVAALPGLRAALERCGQAPAAVAGAPAPLPPSQQQQQQQKLRRATRAAARRALSVLEPWWGSGAPR